MTKRINITVSDSVHETLKSISEDYGMPISSLGAMAIMVWLEQKQAVGAIGDIQGIMEKVSVMQKSINCACYECATPVKDTHFTAFDGRILCDKCSVGVEPLSPKLKKIVQDLK